MKYFPTDVNEDLHKFGFNDVGDFIMSSETHNESIIRLISMDNRPYLDKIKTVYPVYKYNHQAKFLTKASSQNVMKEYIPSRYIYKILPDIYFKDEDKYRVPKQLLEMSREEVEAICLDYIEKCGKVEGELEKALLVSNLVYDYIHNNYHLLDEVATLEERVCKLRKVNKVLKEKLFENTLKSFKSSIKMNNINKMKTSLLELNKINVLLKDLDSLSKHTNMTNYSLQRDLIKKIINEISNMKYSDIRIVESIKEHLKRYDNISLNLINEFKMILVELREQMITFEIYGYVDSSEPLPYVSII
jgi:hypothetical protein